jgi:methylenetetrahydrofolate dehydrogenase (NADP+)/methenyltetrahydrofolate cyclohydrolase
MAILFDGKKEAEKIYTEITSKISNLSRKPSLGIIRAGNKANQVRFTEMKKKTAANLGLVCEITELNETSGEQEILGAVADMSSKFDAVLVQLPLPENIDRYKIFNSIPYEKDIEGASATRAGEFLQGIPELYSPVAMAAIHAVQSAVQNMNTPIAGKHAVVVGNSYIAGKPVSQILYNLGATVTLCGSRTSDLASFTKQADILVSCTGQKYIITSEMVKPGTIAVDVGYDLDENQNIFADMDPKVAAVAGFFTPTPGGIGPLTIAYIFKNLLTLTGSQK